MYTYKTRGVCSRAINFEIENSVITDCRFEGGCSGNTQGVAALVVGMTVEEAVRRLKGIKCGMRPTSCPDQLAIALSEHLEA
ncbi:MAG: TIGR03905 family TSCPD domain-containing protein [Clostridia bacterium]|nr:TIGR03905 family TSCPD domain-containing protein [Clostridia bacterium]